MEIPKCKATCGVCGISSNSWEKEFEDKFNYKQTGQFEFYLRLEEVKSFISSLLEKQKEKITNPPNMTGGNTGTLTPLGESLQSKCPNCPKYPELLDAVQMIRKIARGAVLQETAENADYFCSIKFEGEEFNIYVRENNKI